MTGPGHFEEPLQKLPGGMPRGFAEYRPAAAAGSGPPVINVGGYDGLVAYLRSKGMELPRSADGLAALDRLLDSPDERAALVPLVRPIGMFYGDILTHTVPSAHWEVIADESPQVRVTSRTAVSVISVAQRRLTIGVPTLVQNYVHVLEMVNREN
jgi:hypothetical protein